jgi:methylenetetrahydrofolate--tRNA-(uracil-5-)-methyltransferase
VKSVVNIIGAGLAGTEAALYLANRGIKVRLFEMRLVKESPAHKTKLAAELVCSNSLKNNALTNACGLLKEEMRILGSEIIKAADESQIPGGNALVVDREIFSRTLDEKIRTHPNIEYIGEEVTKIPKGITIIASGPLTSPSLEQELKEIIGEESLYFFDASSPIIEFSSINLDIGYFKSRYSQGDDSYLNCPFTREEYALFYNELINAKTAKVSSFDTNYFSGCMPIEVMAKKGFDTLRFGPLKPRGLEKDKASRPFAVVQLRQEDINATLYNLVGFQTNLTYSEQERVFRLIPGLENAKFVRFGLMHRNTYINSPASLNSDLSLIANNDIFIAGQLSGVEGYVESAASGLLVAINVLNRLKKKETLQIPYLSMHGALINYIINASPVHFSPMNANFGILPNPKNLSREEQIELALNSIKQFKEEIEN